MKKFFRFLRIALLGVVAIAALLTIATILFVNMSPQFGEEPPETVIESMHISNYKDGKFHNQIPTHVGLTFGQTLSVMREFFFGDKAMKTPENPPPVLKLDPTLLEDRSTEVSRLTWFGHSAVLLEIDGKKILLDPMLGQHAGPLSLLSPARFNADLPIEIERLPVIDAVLISHDHYDHLDYGSIRKLKDKVRRFYAPIGVGSHLRSWGVEDNAIVELNWWDETSFEGFSFICAPARHFSGRGFTNNKTLWCSWIVRSSSQQLYFSGDSGYGPHFEQIGERYGAMDFAMIECGQYNELWKAIHMMPEETVQASRDVKAKRFMPIHWGAFSLAMHPWTDPVVRAMAEAKRLGVTITTPKIGETIDLSGAQFPDEHWWEW